MNGTKWGHLFYIEYDNLDKVVKQQYIVLEEAIQIEIPGPIIINEVEYRCISAEYLGDCEVRI